MGVVTRKLILKTLKEAWNTDLTLDDIKVDELPEHHPLRPWKYCAFLEGDGIQGLGMSKTEALRKLLLSALHREETEAKQEKELQAKHLKESKEHGLAAKRCLRYATVIKKALA